MKLGDVGDLLTENSSHLLEVAGAPSLARRKSAGYVRPAKLKGDPPSPINPPPGCAFAERCPKAQAICKEDRPALKAEGDALVACHFPD